MEHKVETIMITSNQLAKFSLIAWSMLSFQNLFGDIPLKGKHPSIEIETYCKMISEIDSERKNIKTLNQRGSAYCFLNKLTQSFLEYCQSNPNARVLEVGCAYGIKSSQIVQTGVYLVANDLEEKHLDIMRQAFAKLSVKNPLFLNVSYIKGDISNIPLTEFGGKKFDAILVESVLHFLTPHDIQATLKRFNDLLVDNGRVYILTSSPFLNHLVEKYQSNKRNVEKWPGYFEDPEAINSKAARLHKPYHCLDEETLRRELTLAGFLVKESQYLPRPHNENDLALDGREGLVIIAEKQPL